MYRFSLSTVDQSYLILFVRKRNYKRSSRHKKVHLIGRKRKHGRMAIQLTETFTAKRVSMTVNLQQL